MQRTYTNKNSKAGKSSARKNKKNKALPQTQIRNKARNEAYSNSKMQIIEYNEENFANSFQP